MLHVLYVVAFTVIAFLAIANLIRSLITLSMDYQRPYSPARKSPFTASRPLVAHPELLDENGNPTNEPLLVMRSMTVEDAREKLDALYKSSPGTSVDKQEEF
ncbi:MAG TPA: DUF2973 domain-containing protein [Cyanobacteria bacterium UBA11370]|nr:DUF2973 domain-containing protein [Cyanobacteria bacterium UBA11370]HBY76005.1 DUF2973 domain-containing protein [Cyanobacteria bacterium UBA11148]